MQKVMRGLSIFLVIACLASLCSCAAKAPPGIAELNDYRQIPGITAEEIKAVENLQQKFDRFQLAIMPTNTECFYDENGELRGYSVMLCEWLTDIFDISFAPVFYDWPDTLAGLADYSIDFTGEITATPERRAFLYMTDSISERTLKVIRRIGSRKIEESTAESPVRCCFLAGTTAYSYVEPYVANIEVIYADGLDDVFRLFNEEKIDAFVIDGNAEAMFDKDSSFVAEDFSPMIYAPVSLSTQNPELIPIIDLVQKMLESEYNTRFSDMYKQGYVEYLRYKLSGQLTPEEREYIQQHIDEGIAIPHIAESDNYPISFFNTHEREWQGVSHDIIAEMERLTGLTFDPANEQDAEWPELLPKLTSGEALMASELIYSAEREKHYIWAQDSYYTDYYALLSKADYHDVSVSEIFRAKVGLIQDSAYAEFFYECFPNHKSVVEYPSSSEAVKALEAGKVDLLMASRSVLLNITNYLEKPGFKTNIVFARESKSAFGFPMEEDVLRSIVSKAQRLVDTGAIASRWQRNFFDYSSALERERRPLWVGLVVLVILIIALLIQMIVRHKRASAVLEATVLERTKELEIASNAKGEFLARMSHEIRTPLNAIIGMNNIAMNSSDLEKAHQCNVKIDSASRHLLELINNILDISKIEADKLELSYDEFDFEKMLMRIVNVTNFRVEEKNQELVIHVGEGVPSVVLGDELRLSQVVTNLLSNAVKFTPENGLIVVNVKKTAEFDNGSVTLRVAVTDNGIGISQEQQERLFTSFEQADGSISRKFGGTGLGLSISKRIVELMGGHIWIESELGAGSTFVFEISITKCQDRPEIELGIEKEDVRILVADDSAEVLECFTRVLEAHGLPCDTADSGSRALEMIEQRKDSPYNLFFVDWQMPEMNGIELTRKIKEMTDQSAVVFMVSMARWESIEKEAFAAGVNRFIAKPLFPSAVVNAIHECFGVESKAVKLNVQSAESAPVFDNCSVLIAEDIEINREIMTATLEETKIAIDFAMNGMEAVAMYSENADKYDLILMDIQMPEMDGFTATRTIRALELPKAKEIPIIAMTANVFKEDIEKCLSAGMNDHIGNPIDTNDLLKKLRKYLAK